MQKTQLNYGNSLEVSNQLDGGQWSQNAPVLRGPCTPGSALASIMEKLN